jgi:hypothetical protein
MTADSEKLVAQIRVRVTEEMAQKIRALAKLEERSCDGQIRYLLRLGFDALERNGHRPVPGGRP